MKLKQISIYALIAIMLLLPSFAPINGATATTMTLNNVASDMVQINITGTSNSNIQFSFLPPGASTVNNVSLGSTDGTGHFSSTISSGGYSIPSGSPVFATINGVQSTLMLWPSYTSSLTFSQNQVNLAIGQSVTVSASHALTLVLNSLPSDISTSINGSQITISGTNTGSGVLTLCSANAGCNTITVDVGVQSGETELSLDKNDITLYIGKASSATIFGNSKNGYVIKSISNNNALHANIPGKSDTVLLYGDAQGVSTIKICSADNDTNCIDLKVTVLNEATNILSFSENNLILTKGLIKNVTVSGGPDNGYYVLSNSNSSVVAVTVSGSLITAVGGSSPATSVVTICSTSVNNTCGNLNITLTDTSETTDATNILSFSKNVVSVAKKDTVNVTITGGNSTSYSVSANSNPSVVTASIGANSNIIELSGNTEGSSIITICSAGANTACASLFVNVTAEVTSIELTQNNISLSTGSVSIIPITGGNANNTIYSNNNSQAVSAKLSNNNSTIILNGGDVSGSATIVICPSSDYSNKCVNLYTTNKGLTNSTTASNNTDSGTLIKASGPAVYYLASNGKRYVFPNENTYKSWYSDFSSVKTISDAELASYQIGGNVTYRPGSKMVKITSDPKVYAIDASGKLRLIVSETVAVSLYGANWAKMVEDIPDAFFINYTIGQSIYSLSDFNPTNARTTASSINFDKGLES